MKQRFIGLALLVVPAAILAHPHARVDQQAQMSISRSEIMISFRVIPSTQDGAHMFDHLDTDSNGVISNREKTAFGSSLIANSHLTVDGGAIRLRLLDVEVPARAKLRKGQGLISVRGRALASLPAGREHKVAFQIDDRQFAKGWFIQPFYHPDLTDGRSSPDVSRRAGRSSVQIRIAPK